MRVVLAQPESRMEAFAEEALEAAGMEVQLAGSWEEAMAHCLGRTVDVLLVAPETPRAHATTVRFFCSLPRTDRPGVVLWGGTGSLAAEVAVTDRVLPAACRARDLVEAVADAGELAAEPWLEDVEEFPSEDGRDGEGCCLVAACSPERRDELVRALRFAGMRAEGASSPDALVVLLYLEEVRLVIVDMGLEDERALGMARAVRSWSPDLPVVLWTDVLTARVQQELPRLHAKVVSREAGPRGLLAAAAALGGADPLSGPLAIA